MPQPELVYLTYSPWSEKARWALEHHAVPHTRVHYQPMLGEPAMRLRTRNWTGTVSVPVLFEGGRCHRDSCDIARFAERVGNGTPLFPEEHESAIERWDALGQAGLAAGRALGLVKVLEDREALSDLVPKGLRRILGPAALPIAAFGVRRTQRKYGAVRENAAEHQGTLRDTLEALREALQPTEGPGPDTVLGRFSYADITIAQVVQFVSPKNIGRFRLAPASQRAYHRADLEREFADLVQWRDALYAHHREPS